MAVSEETRNRILEEAGLPRDWVDQEGKDIKPEPQDLVSASWVVRTAPSPEALVLAIAATMADGRAIVTKLVERIAVLEAAR